MNFDQISNRIGNENVPKWAITAQQGHEDVTALTIADMDFETPDFILNNLVPTSRVLGYEEPSDQYYDSIINWQKQYHHVSVNKNEIIPLTGVLPGISFALQKVTSPNDAVLVFDPVYGPFSMAVNNLNRKLIEFDLTISGDGQYEIDFDKLKDTLSKQKIRAMIICNPQNPSGHVWTRADLLKLSELAQQNNIFMIADEIHQDLVFEPERYTSLFEIPGVEGYAIVISAPTKTFNMPGVQSAYMFVKDAFLRDQIKSLMDDQFISGISTTGVLATTAALTQGKSWHDELMKYLKENRDTIFELFDGTKIKPMLPQATYLMWLDFSAIGLSDLEIDRKLINDAKVQLNMGSQYGQDGTGWFRLNFATSRDQLVKAVRRIIEVF